MSAAPLVTVITVTYNSAKYVASAIESVLCQSYENLELVICDDCSTDGTWEIVQNYQDPRIRAFRNPKNIGEYANRNQALGLAEGKYVIYIDGDDIIYPHGLEFMVKMLEAFPDCGMAMARPWSEKFVYPVELSPREFFLCQFLGQDVSAINFAHLLMRTESLRDVGGLSTRYKSGDTYIQYHIALKYSCLLISDGLAWWRRTPGQASEKLLRSHELALEGVQYRLEALRSKECPLREEEIDRAKANVYGGFIRLAIRCAIKGRVATGFNLLRKARVPIRAWKYLLVPGRYTYMSDISAARPMAVKIERNPLSRIPESLR